MDDIQERKLSTYYVVAAVLNAEEFRPIWSPMEEFAGNVAELGVLMEKIRNALEIQATDRTGTTIEKKLARVRLVDAMLPVIYGVRALGIFTNDEELEMSIWFNRWQLMHSRDNLLASRALVVYEKAFPLRNELVKCKVTEADIVRVTVLNEEFRELMPQPRWETVQRKGATDELRRLFKATDDLLYNVIDQVIMIFKVANPEFVERYFFARRIVDTGVRHDKVKPGVLEGTVLMAGTEMELEKVRVVIEGRKRVVKTNDKGWFKFWFKKKAMVRPVFELEGFEKKLGEEVEMGPGMKEVVRVEMRKLMN